MGKKYRPICIKNRITVSFAEGCNGIIMNSREVNFKKHLGPLIVRGLAKRKLIARAIAEGRDYYYIDTGYFGNRKRKVWHRVVKNNVQHDKIITRRPDRFDNLGISMKQWKKDGRKILLCPPSKKSMVFYGENLEDWMKNIMKTIKKHTDRPIEIRYKPRIRHERINSNTIEAALMDDVFCLVTYNSITATEAVFNGIPAFTLAPNAASPVCLQDLSRINNPIYPDRQMWVNHLAYGQFTEEEMLNGAAWKILNRD
jgi:hypothetical protein